MLPARYDPFGGMPSVFGLRRDIDRLFRDFMRDLTGDVDLGEAGGEMAIAPRVDLVEKNDAFVLDAEMPGIDPKDVKVQVTGDTLRIEGEKREERSEGGQGGIERFRERSWRRYQRTLTLPGSIDASKIQANLRNGILTLTLPKSEQAKSRQIEVKGEGAKPIDVPKPEKKKDAA